MAPQTLQIFRFIEYLQGMYPRLLESGLSEMLTRHPVVGLLGPRQVGKTTLALEVGDSRPSIYMDLESPSDLARLAEPELFLRRHEDKLVILDEIQRVPDIFQVVRGLVDQGRRSGKGNGRFLVLGSAGKDLLQQSSESLAGRIAYTELPPLLLEETGAKAADTLWLRGGFPSSFTASDDAASLEWRRNFIRTYLERDIPQLGPRIPAETLRRLWIMLAHDQGGHGQRSPPRRCTRRQRTDRRALHRPALRSAARASSHALGIQRRQTHGEKPQSLCAR